MFQEVCDVAEKWKTNVNKITNSIIRRGIRVRVTTLIRFDELKYSSESNKFISDGDVLAYIPTIKTSVLNYLLPVPWVVFCTRKHDTLSYTIRPNFRLSR